MTTLQQHLPPRQHLQRRSGGWTRKTPVRLRTSGRGRRSNNGLLVAVATSFLLFLLSSSLLVAPPVLGAHAAEAECSAGGDCDAAPTEGGADRVITAEELASKVGKGDDPTIWLAVLGEVYDVTPGKEFYGSGSSYSFFAGRDASPCFATGDFTDEGAKKPLDDLPAKQLKGIVEWKSFYDKHETYKRIGVLGGGLFYDEEGKETDLLKTVKDRVASLDAAAKPKK